MKIAFVGPVTLELLEPFYGARTVFPRTHQFPMMSHLVNEYLAAGNYVHVFTFGEKASKEIMISGHNLRVTVIPNSNADLLAFGVRPIWRMRRAIQISGCEVIHANWMYEYALSGILSGIPCLVTAHDDPVRIFRFSPNVFRLIKLFLGFGVGVTAKHITVPSPYLRDAIRSIVRVDPIVVPNGLPKNYLVAPRRKHSTNRVILSVNNGFDKRKNLTRLIEAFFYVRRQFPEANLRLVGRDYQPLGPAETFARERGLANGVSFLGPVTQESVMDEIDRADILVHPSLEESFGMIVVEALGRGLPVLAGRNSGAPAWLLDSGRCGELCDMSNSRTITQSICSLLGSKRRLSLYSLRGFQRVVEHFMLKDIASRYASILEYIVQEKSASRR